MDSVQNCIFCQIAAGHSPAQVEYRDDEMVVFWDIQPNAPIHLLVVSKKHISTLKDTQNEDAPLLGKMLLMAQEIAKRKGFAEDGYRIVINTGKNADQIVDHIHFHILAGTNLGIMTAAKDSTTGQYGS